MADYIIYIGAVMTASSLLYMLLPEGSVRRVASLATGFLVISAILSPVGRGIPNISVKLPLAEQKDLESAKKSYRANVIQQHRKNLCKIIKQRLKNGGTVFVDTDNDGNIKKITLRVKGDESAAVSYIVSELSVPRERITIIYENN